MAVAAHGLIPSPASRPWHKAISPQRQPYPSVVTLLDAHSVVLITGISAAGKSTVAELLARRFPQGVHVKGDVFRRMIVAGRAEMTASPSQQAYQQLRLRYRL